jgi:parallel beta-helix repeat protein
VGRNGRECSRATVNSETKLLRWACWIGVSAILLAFSIGQVRAQNILGLITGLVQEPSGARVAGAKVTAPGQETRVQYPANTAAAGGALAFAVGQGPSSLHSASVSQGMLEAQFYVSPKGNDAWSGRMAEPNQAGTDGPFRTLARARDAVRQLGARGQAPVRVLIRGGVYELAEPLTFTPQDSGTESAPVVYSAYPGETPVLSGGRRITDWKPDSNGVWSAQVSGVKEGEWYFHQLFVNGQRRQRARTPNSGFFNVEGQIAMAAHPAHFKFHPGDIRPEWAGTDAEIVGLNEWQTYRMAIAGVDEASHTVTLSANVSRNYSEANSRYWIENTRDALDARGEWYLSRKEGVVYYRPEAGEDMSTAEVTAPMLLQLVRFEGDADSGKYVHDITLQGLTFSYADWAIPAKGFVDGQAACAVPAAVEARGARHCTIEKCVLTHLGEYAVAFGQGSKQIHIIRNEMSDLGGGGIKIGDCSSNVNPRPGARRQRPPLPPAPEAQASGQQSLFPKHNEFRYPLDEASYRAAPQYPHNEAQTSSHNVISDNRIHDVGAVFQAGVPIWIGQSPDNIVSHNEIYNTYYSGISCGWTWGFGPSAARNNIIEFNLIYNVGRGLLSDMGAIYILGIQPRTVVRNNVLHDVRRYKQPEGYFGNGIYLDSGSSQIRVENNIIYRTDDAGIFRNSGMQNVVTNNIFAFVHQMPSGHIKSAPIQDGSGAPHVTLTFEHNIVYWNQGDPVREGGRGRFLFDHNLYYPLDGQSVQFLVVRIGEVPWAQWQKYGQDVHSLIANPLFVNPEQNDFSLKAGSPAFKIGFHPIDVSGVGPREKLP